MDKYWPEGTGELFAYGKYRMYKLGQFIRQEYGKYLGSEYSPREVYTRSSAESRCLESASMVMAGAYPPMNKTWQWNQGRDAQLGQEWQPMSIYTYPLEMMDEDRLLRIEAKCPTAQQFSKNYFKTTDKKLIEKNKQFVQNVSKIIGESQEKVLGFYDVLYIELERGYKWSDKGLMSEEWEQTVLKKVKEFYDIRWSGCFNAPVVWRTRGGPLVKELLKNFDNKIQTNDKKFKKLFHYSSHDDKLVILLQALGVFNNLTVPFGATVLFELHQKPENGHYFVRLYYHNETLTGTPHALRIPQCDYQTDCPIDKYRELSHKLIPDDWEQECGLTGAIFSELDISLSISSLL
ncbi:prostatic acid phosphatase-like [Oppia nitens]|uniref:prostatic acid phosphatase-like n=1 Tax=Oppia nitens TaxID=1686743 RepID=UPI0023DC79CA|nr:prostatic acid phosphatase-like [Oppia nitens]